MTGLHRVKIQEKETWNGNQDRKLGSPLLSLTPTQAFLSACHWASGLSGYWFYSDDLWPRRDNGNLNDNLLVPDAWSQKPHSAACQEFWNTGCETRTLKRRGQQNTGIPKTTLPGVALQTAPAWSSSRLCDYKIKDLLNFCWSNLYFIHHWVDLSREGPSTIPQIWHNLSYKKYIPQVSSIVYHLEGFTLSAYLGVKENKAIFSFPLKRKDDISTITVRIP